MLALLLATFSSALVWAVPNYTAERDPPRPEPSKQYRMWLRTPDRSCASWRKVTAVLPKEDMLVSESKRDETGKNPGCKFLWVITPASAPGDLKFELEGLTGSKESFEVPMAGSPASSGKVLNGGIANENGTGMASGPVKGSLRLPGVGVENKGPSKSSDPGTGF